MDEQQIYEIKIRRVEELSEDAKKEVQIKLTEGEYPNFKGYAKITYSKCSSPRVTSVDPINGTIFNFLKEIVPR